MVEPSDLSGPYVLLTKMNDHDEEGTIAEEVVTSDVRTEQSVAMPKEMRSITAGSSSTTGTAGTTSVVVQKPIILFKWGSKEKPFRCQMCEMSFETGERLQEHMEKHRQSDLQKKPFPCKICPKAFRARKTLEKHSLVHFGQSTKRCKFCFRGFTNKENLEKHMQEHGGRKPHKCPQCNESFAYKLGLSNHMVIHTGLKNFVCEFCNKAFNRKDILERHRVLHTGLGRRHKCVECNKTFAHSFVLKRHARCVHSGESSPCVECGKHIKGKENMSRHMKLHRGERPYVCLICSKAFTQNHHLKDHMLLHTQERHYQCEQCPESFVHRRSYTRHVQRHLGVERPTWQCPICARNFTEKGSLTKHMQVHDGTSHQCKFCKVCFKREKQLIRHLNRVHEDDMRQLALQKASEGDHASSEEKGHNLSSIKKGDNPVIEVVFPPGSVSKTQQDISRRAIERTSVIDAPYPSTIGELLHLKGDNPDEARKQSPNVLMIVQDFTEYAQKKKIKVVYCDPDRTGRKAEVKSVVKGGNQNNSGVILTDLKGGNLVSHAAACTVAETRRSCRPQSVELLAGSNVVQQSLTAVDRLKQSSLSKCVVNESKENHSKTSRSMAQHDTPRGVEIPAKSDLTAEIVDISVEEASERKQLIKNKETEVVAVPEKLIYVNPSGTVVTRDVNQSQSDTGLSYSADNDVSSSCVDDVPPTVGDVLSVAGDEGKAVRTDRQVSYMEQEHTDLIQSIIDYAEQLRQSDNQEHV